MRFVITALATEDVVESLRVLANEFAERLRTDLNDLVLSSGAESILYAPVVMPETMGSVADTAVFLPRQSAIKLSQNINHAEWLTSGYGQRVQLYAGALIRGLRSVSEAAVSVTELESLCASVDRVKSALVDGAMQRAVP